MSVKKENNNLNSPLVDRGIKILMTGGGAPGAAGILKCLQQEKSFQVTVADADPDATGKYLNNDFETIPFAGDADFADAVFSLCRKKNIRAVLPLVTKELIPLAERKTDFENAGIKILVSPAASLEIANNKSRLYEFLQWRGITVPEFRIVDGSASLATEQFKNAVTELGYPEKTVCFKPSVSNGSRGFRIISEQMNELDLLFNHKPNSVYISLNEAVRILSSGFFPELLVSEYLPGEEFSVDCLARYGEPVIIIPRRRLKMINGISVSGEFVKEENIIEYCRQIIKELQLHGNIGIQVKKSQNDSFLILEINPRVQGTISSALGAGINLPVLSIKQEFGLPILPVELEVKWGTKFSKYWQDVFH